MNQNRMRAMKGTQSSCKRVLSIMACVCGFGAAIASASDVTALLVTNPVYFSSFPASVALVHDNPTQFKYVLDGGSSSENGLAEFRASFAAFPDAETTVSLPTSGVYTVTLTVEDALGNTASTTSVIRAADGGSRPFDFWEIPQDQMEARGVYEYILYQGGCPPGMMLRPEDGWMLFGGSKWSASFLLDLGGEYPIAGVGFYASGYRPKSVKVYGTDEIPDLADPGGWGAPVAAAQLADATAWHTVSFPARTGRYVVVQIQDGYDIRYNNGRLKISEIKVYAERPFALASSVTGDTHFCNTNTLDVVRFPVAGEYDRYQVTSSSEAPAGDDPHWQAYNTNSLPESVTFDVPDPEGDISLYAWLNNSSGVWPPTSFPTTVTYVRNTADVTAVAPASVTADAWGETFPAVIRAFDLRPQVAPLHAPYVGGDSSATIGLHSLTVACPQDETPSRGDIVVLSRPGSYLVTLTATDRAGNQDARNMAVTVRDQALTAPGTRFVEDWSEPANHRTWPEAWQGRGPYFPPVPRSGNWNVTWPQRWLIDYLHRYGSQSLDEYPSQCALLSVETDPLMGSYGHWGAKQQFYAYMENSCARDVEIRLDFRVGVNQASVNNVGIVARYRPEDPGTAANERRGYRLCMHGSTGQRYLTLAYFTSNGDLSEITRINDVVTDEWMSSRWHITQQDRDMTRLQARIWKIGDPEPEDWMIDVLDDTPDNQLPGRIGLYGQKYSSSDLRFGRLEAKIPALPGTLFIVQ